MDGVSEKFQVLATNLAHNDAKMRAKALNAISVRIKTIESTIEKVEMMKIWKGIFSCVWMSDKRAVQENLCDRIAALTCSLASRDVSLLYLECFWQTMCREWPNIDYLRLDKYYYLCRRMLVATADFLASCEYAPAIMEKYTKIMSSHPLNPEFGKVPAAISYFVCENALMLFDATPEPSVIDRIEIMAPFLDLILSTQQPVVLEKLNAGLFDPIFGVGAEDEVKYAWKDEELLKLATALLMIMDNEEIPDASIARLQKYVEAIAEKFGGFEQLLTEINGPEVVEDEEEEVPPLPKKQRRRNKITITELK